MLETLGESFSDAIHHRNGCLHALVVRQLHDLEPAIGAGLFRSDDVADALNEDLSPATRNRIESRFAQLADDVNCVQAEQLGEEINFTRTEPVNVDRVITLDVPHQVEVPLKRDIGVVPALNQDLHSAKRLELFDLGSNLLERKRVPFTVLGPPRECAESAIRNTHVGVIDVAIDDVSDRIAGMFFLADAICFSAQLQQRSVGIEVEEIAGFAHAAGRKVRVPFGILPRSTSRR